MGRGRDVMCRYFVASAGSYAVEHHVQFRLEA